MSLSSLLLAYQDINLDPNAPDAVAAGGGIMGALCSGVGLFICVGFLMAFMLIPLIGVWKLFEKAGKPGWAAIVPFYNMFILTEIAGMDIMWFFLCFIPCFGAIPAIIIWANVFKNFGKDTTFTILAILFPFIFIPMLGFSDARYTPMKH